MNSHDLANALLKLPNKPVIAVLPVGREDAAKGYTHDRMVTRAPWEDSFGCIRLPVDGQDLTAEANQ